MRVYPMQFREVTDQAGAAEVSALARDIWREHYIPLIGPAQVEYMLEKLQSPTAIMKQLAERFRYFLILDASGQTAGYFGARSAPGEIFLSKLYVRRSARGQGLAKRAVNYLAEWGREKAAGRIRLTVNRHNAGSIAAYRHMGFRVLRPVVQDIGGGFVMDDLEMALNLADGPVENAHA